MAHLTDPADACDPGGMNVDPNAGLNHQSFCCPPNIRAKNSFESFDHKQKHTHASGMKIMKVRDNRFVEASMPWSVGSQCLRGSQIYCNSKNPAAKKHSADFFTLLSRKNDFVGILLVTVVKQFSNM